METTDENLGKVRTTYNRLGYPTQIDDISGAEYKLASYTYDGAGRLWTEQDSKNTQAVYSYDYLNRVTSKNIGYGQYMETYEYNDAFSPDLSRVVKTIHGGGSSPDIRMATYTNSHGFTAHTSRFIGATEVLDNFTYDFLCNQLTATTSDNRTTEFKYDSAGRLTWTKNPDNSTYQATYDWLGRNTTATKGHATNYKYNALGLMTEESVPFEGDHVKSITTYHYDLNGNLTSQRQSNNKPGAAPSESRADYEYSNRDFLTKVTSYNKNAVDNFINYTYDNVGNTTFMATANGTQLTQYQYDKQNRLTTLTDPLGMTETYGYDNNNSTYSYRTDGLRLSKTVNGVKTSHIWDSGNIVAELNGSGTMTNQFVRGLNLIKMVEGPNENFYLFNAHGDVIQLTNKQGAVNKNYYYDAFGNDLPSRDRTITTANINIFDNVEIREVTNPSTGEKSMTLVMPPKLEGESGRTRPMPLNTGATYILEFNYWADVDNSLLVAGLYPDLPSEHLMAGKTVKKHRVEISSDHPNMSEAVLLFYSNAYYQPGTVYVTNVRFYDKATAETFMIAGDVNGDGKVTAADATMILLYLDGKVPDIDLEAADVNGDGVVNGLDVELILQYVAGLPVALENGFILGSGSTSSYIYTGAYVIDGINHMSAIEDNFPSKISYTPTGYDPHFSTRLSNIRDDEVTVRLKITANEDSLGQIFWGIASEAYPFTEEKSKWFDVKSGTHEYAVNLGRISLNLLRIDVGVAGSRVTLSGVRVYTTKEHESNPFKFASELYDSDLGEYYLRARQAYNPRIGRFSQADPYWNVNNMIYGSPITHPRPR